MADTAKLQEAQKYLKDNNIVGAEKQKLALKNKFGIDYNSLTTPTKPVNTQQNLAPQQSVTPQKTVSTEKPVVQTQQTPQTPVNQMQEKVLNTPQNTNLQNQLSTKVEISYMV